MRYLLLLTGSLTLVAPMVYAMLADAADKPRRVEAWLLLQVVTVVSFGLAAWLRAREIRQWPLREGTIVASKQTGAFGQGILAMRVEVSHGSGMLDRVVNTVRVPMAEVQRYAVGAKVSVAVNPHNPQERKVV